MIVFSAEKAPAWRPHRITTCCAWRRILDPHIVNDNRKIWSRSLDLRGSRRRSGFGAFAVNRKEVAVAPDPQTRLTVHLMFGSQLDQLIEHVAVEQRPQIVPQQYVGRGLAGL